jgi:DNA-binding transcriptional LysR family regulator
MQKYVSQRLGALNWDDLRYFLQVARTQRASAAAKRLGVDHTTVARRVRELEAALGVILFDKSRADGFTLTSDGHRLLHHADAVETAVQSASEQFSGGAQDLSGHVRIGSTEGFGCFFYPRKLPALLPGIATSPLTSSRCPTLSASPSVKLIWPLRSNVPSAANTFSRDSVWRDNLDERRATIRMRMSRRG